jgi:hypothetical protein
MVRSTTPEALSKKAQSLGFDASAQFQLSLRRGLLINQNSNIHPRQGPLRDVDFDSNLSQP